MSTFLFVKKKKFMKHLKNCQYHMKQLLRGEQIFFSKSRLWVSSNWPKKSNSVITLCCHISDLYIQKESVLFLFWFKKYLYFQTDFYPTENILLYKTEQECQTDTTNSVFGQFKGHNSGVPGGFGWLYNLVEILCPPTYSPSLIKTWWKLFDLEKGNPVEAARPLQVFP